ncbi:DUF2291 family protein [Halomonas huangheensis]|uniref:Lipoprotein n=1 Tax=Halomonas huangheensis TaxID=1178482 RepID=W1N8L6_9GAMM|nr:DUF2291 domain-containing protein [Halomonas huangheensis]ALM50984.1 hypothetical protein AR456_00750 [Halomonas huangheensis]ERL51275.1 hypothetical protein BJB45_15340 [Halomonas huangheensis]
MTTTVSASRSHARPRRRLIITCGFLAVLVAAMVFDTRVIKIGSEADQRQAGFSPQQYGAEQFPAVQSYVIEHAVEASELAAALNADKTAAIERHGVEAGIGPVLPVTFSGTVGEGKAGIYDVRVPGLPETLTLRMQTGPAINGTDLRDATGEIEFGQFTNQIEYQNAGAALNNTMKQQVLADIDTANLSGKQVEVTGVFKLINPSNWLVTPVRFSVQQP